MYSHSCLAAVAAQSVHRGVELMEWSVKGRLGQVRGFCGYLMEANHIRNTYSDALRKPVYVPTHVLLIALHSQW